MSIGPWDFNGFDIAVLIILLISLLFAAQRGLVREVLSIIALVVAAVIAFFVFGRYGTAARDFISPTWLANWILGLGTFALSYTIIVILLSGMTKSLKGKEVGFTDKLLGAAFGAARGLLITALATVPIVQLLGSTPPTPEGSSEIQEKLPPDFIKDSSFYPLLNKISKAIPFSQIKETAQEIESKGEESISQELQ